MANLSQRVAELEDTAHLDGCVIVMWKHMDETNVQAMKRWRTEHPGESDATDLQLIVVRWSKSNEQGALPAAGALSDDLLASAAVCSDSAPRPWTVGKRQTAKEVW